MRSKMWLSPGLWLVLLLAGGVRADERLPAGPRVTVLFTALTYDNQLETRCAGGLRIGVLSMPGDETSQAVAKETHAAIAASSGKKIKGLSILSEVVVAAGMDELRQAVQDRRLNTLYLSPGWEKLLPSLLKLAKEKQVLLLTGEPAHVRAGVALGVVQRDNKPKIMVHLESATAEGAKFDVRLLKLAEVVR